MWTISLRDPDSSRKRYGSHQPRIKRKSVSDDGVTNNDEYEPYAKRQKTENLFLSLSHLFIFACNKVEL